MTMRPIRILLAIAVLALLTLAWLGVSGGINQWPQPQTPGQRLQTITQFAYGFLSLAVVLSVWKTRYARLIRNCWLASLTVAGGIAPVVWGDAGWFSGVVAAIGSLAIGSLILWLLSVGSRGLTE